MCIAVKWIQINICLYVCVSVTILTSRLALVSRRATVWHLQVGLAAAAVLDGLWALGRRRRGAREVRKTTTQLFYNSNDSRDS